MQRLRILRFALPIFLRRVLPVFLLSFCVAGLSAQGTSGVLTGTVTDSTGAVIPNADVKISNPISGYSQTAKADAQGQYRFPNLPFGRYHVTAGAGGFDTIALDAQVSLHRQILWTSSWQSAGRTRW